MLVFRGNNVWSSRQPCSCQVNRMLQGKIARSDTKTFNTFTWPQREWRHHIKTGFPHVAFPNKFLMLGLDVAFVLLSVFLRTDVSLRFNLWPVPATASSYTGFCEICFDHHSDFFWGVSGYSSLINVAQIRTKIFQEKHRRDDCIRSDDTFKWMVFICMPDMIDSLTWMWLEQWQSWTRIPSLIIKMTQNVVKHLLPSFQTVCCCCCFFLIIGCA